MDVDSNLTSAPVAFTFAFGLRSSFPGPAICLDQTRLPSSMSIDVVSDIVQAFPLVSLVEAESSADMHLSSADSMISIDGRMSWQHREPAAALNDEDDHMDTAQMFSAVKEASPDVPLIHAGDSLASLVDLTEQWSVEVTSDVCAHPFRLHMTDFTSPDR